MSHILISEETLKPAKILTKRTQTQEYMILVCIDNKRNDDDGPLYCGDETYRFPVKFVMNILYYKFIIVLERRKLKTTKLN